VVLEGEAREELNNAVQRGLKGYWLCQKYVHWDDGGKRRPIRRIKPMPKDRRIPIN
jgi:hypothetical protein